MLRLTFLVFIGWRSALTLATPQRSWSRLFYLQLGQGWIWVATHVAALVFALVGLAGTLLPANPSLFALVLSLAGLALNTALVVWHTSRHLDLAKQCYQQSAGQLWGLPASGRVNEIFTVKSMFVGAVGLVLLLGILAAGAWVELR